MQILTQELRSNNDVNGNPRRISAIYEIRSTKSYSTKVIYLDQGYRGHDQVIREYWKKQFNIELRFLSDKDSNIIQLPSLDIPVSEYNRLTK